jgi:hypothetical protein
MPRVVKNAKIALCDFGFTKFRMRMGIQVEITNPKELEAVRDKYFFFFFVFFLTI